MENEYYNGAIYNATDEWKTNHYQTHEIANNAEVNTSIGTEVICPIYKTHNCYPTCMYHTVDVDSDECYCRYGKRCSDCFKE